MPQKISVTTKQLIKNGKWGCSATHNCYDLYEVADTITEAQTKIVAALRKRGYLGEVLFEPPKHYVKTKIIGQCVSPIEPKSFRIDRGMV